MWDSLPCDLYINHHFLLVIHMSTCGLVLFIDNLSESKSKLCDLFGKLFGSHGIHILYSTCVLCSFSR